MELGIALKSQENRENSYKESTDGLGVSQIVYYGSNEVMGRKQLRAWLAYQLLSGGKESRSDWSAEVQMDYRSRSVTASQYPFFRKQSLHVTGLWLQEPETGIKAGRYGLLPPDWTCRVDGAV